MVFDLMVVRGGSKMVAYGGDEVVKNPCGIRGTIRPFIIHKVGNGIHTSAWYDTWCDLGNFSDVISFRDITREGFSASSTVNNLLGNSGWNWPPNWLIKHPLIATINVPDVSVDDKVLWKLSDENLGEFSTSNVWESLRPRAPKVNWFYVVWFSNHIPRHACVVWLLVGENLKTQDKLKDWEVSHSQISTMSCSLCKTQQDSHAHLFFECPFSSKVWFDVSRLSDFPRGVTKWRDIIDLLCPVAHLRSARVVVMKLIFAATTYFIWQERNARLFNKSARSTYQLAKIIQATVRLKLRSLKLKDTNQVRRIKAQWMI
ncbi:uncharacterized protein [Rutidosis leptorrhynchoides]|uniref:uncharacterized protein n=1 Tax=Rutidosis leptorrhynchoides TaxID=125765 RepID=UPI003A9A3539